MTNMLTFLLKKMWVAFAFAKAIHIFFSKNTCELDIVLQSDCFLFSYIVEMAIFNIYYVQ